MDLQQLQGMLKSSSTEDKDLALNILYNHRQKLRYYFSYRQAKLLHASLVQCLCEYSKPPEPTGHTSSFQYSQFMPNDYPFYKPVVKLVDSANYHKLKAHDKLRTLAELVYGIQSKDKV